MLISIHDQRTQFTTSHIRRSVDRPTTLQELVATVVNCRHKIKDDIVNIVIVVK